MGQKTEKKRRKIEEQNQRTKGFTLVELIVVLVVLSILAAIAVPALLGYIDKAKEKKVLQHAQQAYQAAVTLASDRFTDASSQPTCEDVKEMAGVPGTVSKMTFTSSTDYVDATDANPFTYIENEIIWSLKDGTWSQG